MRTINGVRSILKRELGQTKQGREDLAATTAAGVLAELRADPTLPFRRCGMSADPWQVAFLHSGSRRESMLCCRQAGKSTATAARVAREALLHPMSDCLVFSPTLRQSMELLRKVRVFLAALGWPVAEVSNTKTQIELANGSRIVSLPDNESGVVGFSAPRLVVIDEASRVSDELYVSVRPMLAVGRGTLLTLSTPFGNEGWFFRIWDDSAEGIERRDRLREAWRRTEVPASQVSRISADFLNDERIELGDRWYRQEYELAFLDSIDAVFSQDVIRGARLTETPDERPAIMPLF